MHFCCYFVFQVISNRANWGTAEESPGIWMSWTTKMLFGVNKWGIIHLGVNTKGLSTVVYVNTWSTFLKLSENWMVKNDPKSKQRAWKRKEIEKRLSKSCTDSEIRVLPFVFFSHLPPNKDGGVEQARAEQGQQGVNDREENVKCCYRFG